MKNAFLITGLLAIVASAPVVRAAEGDLSFDQAQDFLRKYCESCHNEKAGVGGFRLGQIATQSSLSSEAERWTSLTRRVRNGEMPPKGSPAPPLEKMEEFAAWAEKALRAEACSGGIQPGPAPIRRLNRDEYSATIRDLLDVHLDIGQNLPADGGGGEGFDNAAETLFLSPIHSEKYMEAAQFALEFAAKEFKSRNKILVAQPGRGVSETQAARKILEEFLPKAFRRPVTQADTTQYLALFHAARKQGQDFNDSIFFTLRGVLVSPRFLFRVEPRNTSGKVEPIDSYSLAARLSYFVWGSMPDEFLFDLAATGNLHDPAVMKVVVGRMLRNDRSLGLAQRFVEQWLGTRELAGTKKPDAKLFPVYDTDEELRSDISLQPVFFFRELLTRDESLLNLLDSTHTIGTSNLTKIYGKETMPVRKTNQKQPTWVELEGPNRGGLLGMPAVLAVSSYPYRTSPVLRGAWILDAILGTPPPPPPPDVPVLEDESASGTPKSMRERLSQHRANPVCASCHSRIDGLGFALENYDVLGRWRDEDAGKPIDNSGELASGVKFRGPVELRAVLMDHKDLFIRNLTTKMLGYALGRGLTLQDSCTVDSIVEQVKNKDYKAQALIEAIVLSVPFRYQAPVPRQVSSRPRREPLTP